MMAPHRIHICLNVGSTSSQRLYIFKILSLQLVNILLLISITNIVFIFSILILRSVQCACKQEMQLKGSN